MERAGASPPSTQPAAWASTRGCRVPCRSRLSPPVLHPARIKKSIWGEAPETWKDWNNIFKLSEPYLQPPRRWQERCTQPPGLSGTTCGETRFSFCSGVKQAAMHGGALAAGKAAPALPRRSLCRVGVSSPLHTPPADAASAFFFPVQSAGQHSRKQFQARSRRYTYGSCLEHEV